MPKLDHKATEPKPFSFYDKDMDRYAKKEERIKEVVEVERKVMDCFAGQFLEYISFLKSHK